MSTPNTTEQKLQAALYNLDTCQNKKIREGVGTLFKGRKQYVQCAKYPMGKSGSLPEKDYKKEPLRAEFAFSMGCLGCKYVNVDRVANQDIDARITNLHEAIVAKCADLYNAGHYSESVLKGFMTVRDRLRDLTGYERATDAFGKGHLQVSSANADYLDSDYQEGSKYLMMSIDRFRNVRSHTAEPIDTDSESALMYLTMSSLAMSLLDDASVIDN